MLWVPLFENSENSEETTRNVAAACLGKLATTHPSKYLPQLHVRFEIVYLISGVCLIGEIIRLEFTTKMHLRGQRSFRLSGIRLRILRSHMMNCWHHFLLNFCL